MSMTTTSSYGAVRAPSAHDRPWSRVSDSESLTSCAHTRWIKTAGAHRAGPPKLPHRIAVAPARQRRTGLAADRMAVALAARRRKMPRRALFGQQPHILDCEFAEWEARCIERCYCVVTTGEFTVLSREQMQTGPVEGNLASHSHLVSALDGRRG